MVGALRDPAGDPALRQPRRRPLRSAPRHPVRHPRHVPRTTTRRGNRWLVTTDRGERVSLPLLHHGDRLPLDARRSRRSPASTPSRGAGITPATGRTRASTSAGSASASSAPARPASSRSRSSPGRPRTSTSSSARRTSPSRRATRRSIRRRVRRVKAELRRAAAAQSGVARRASSSIAASNRRSRSTPEEREREFDETLGARRLRLHLRLQRSPVNQDANDTAADYVRARIREIVDDPAVAELLSPRRPPDRHQAPAARHRLLRDLQPRERHAGRHPLVTRSRRSPRPACARATPSTRSTASSSPPASTP